MLKFFYYRGWISFEDEILSSANKKFYLYSITWFRLISPREYINAPMASVFHIDSDGRLNGHMVNSNEGGVQF